MEIASAAVPRLTRPFGVKPRFVLFAPKGSSFLRREVVGEAVGGELPTIIGLVTWDDHVEGPTRTRVTIDCVDWDGGVLRLGSRVAERRPDGGLIDVSWSGAD